MGTNFKLVCFTGLHPQAREAFRGLILIDGGKIRDNLCFMVPLKSLSAEQFGQAMKF